MDKNTVRSDCPISLSLEMLGDKWSLLIIRDIIFDGKRTYNEFLASDEKIATNILASRLTHLLEMGLISKSQRSAQTTRSIYTLTPRGLDLLPVLIELIIWISKYQLVPEDRKLIVDMANADREHLIRVIRKYAAEDTDMSLEAALAKTRAVDLH